ELEATTYSTETGEKATDEREAKRRPSRKKRRPRPEAIAQHRKSGDAADASESPEASDEGEAVAAAGASGSEDQGEAAEG
ncbi:MAG: hypothetical protein OEO23_10840, partial [Gemmatimonadota bacterium]|nr:hypothetical protein [Gemmatimonadota bacterium]